MRKQKPKVKHDMLCNKYKDSGLDNVDIILKHSQFFVLITISFKYSQIVSLKCSWVRSLCNEKFQE